MRRILAVVLISGLTIFSLCFTMAEKSAANQVASPPQRIVSLVPGFTEMLFTLGAGSQVVGVTRYCRYPAEAQKKTVVGGFIDPSLEAIVAQRPDLVVMLPDHIETAAKLKALRIPTLIIENTTIREIAEAYAILGRATGHPGLGQNLQRRFLKRLADTRKQFAELRPCRMMLVIGRSPGALDRLFVAGRNNYFDELIALTHGENIFRDARLQYFQPSLEEIYNRNPEVIIEIRMDRRLSPLEQEKVRAEWKALSRLQAVEKGRVFILNDPYYTVPGESLLKLLGEISRIRSEVR